jgi:hypothetical protein
MKFFSGTYFEEAPKVSFIVSRNKDNPHFQSFLGEEVEGAEEQFISLSHSYFELSLMYEHNARRDIWVNESGNVGSFQYEDHVTIFDEKESFENGCVIQ